MRKIALRWLVGIVLCGAISAGSGIVLWTHRRSSFRWPLAVGGGYALIIQYGAEYDGPFYRSCSLSARHCVSFPPAPWAVTLSYRTAFRMYPLVTLPLRDN
jgi:hypothetical protein